MPVLSAQVAPRRVGEVQVFGHGAQLGEVVQTQAAHKACASEHGQSRGGQGGRGPDAAQGADW